MASMSTVLLMLVGGAGLNPAIAISPTSSPTQPAAGTAGSQTSSKAAAAREAMANPTIRWQRCGPGLQCGEITVPLDYADPSKGTMVVNLSRRPADQPSNRIGSVFINPGGPGGSSVDAVPSFADSLGPQVRQRFDIVGVQPRGLTDADPAVCTPTTPPPTTPEYEFPFLPSQQRRYLEFTKWLQASCAQNEPRVLDHMSTASTARDLDQVRRAVGDPKLTYYGGSYGSFLGATYANLFPDKVRAVAVDGVLDPVAWTTGAGNQATTQPVTERLGSHLGAQEGLMAAIAECERVGPQLCPQAPTIRQDYKDVTSKLRAGAKVSLGELDLTYDKVMGILLAILYDYESVPIGLSFISDVQDLLVPPTAGERRPAALQRNALASYQEAKRRADRVRDRGTDLLPTQWNEDFPEDSGLPVTFQGVLCSDSVNPTDRNAWLPASVRTDRQAPGFGPRWLWSSAACAGWPGSDPGAYRGPFTKKPANGLLVLSTRYDPATPLSGAKALRAMSPGSKLVIGELWGHGTTRVSTCVDEIRTRYLLTGALPADDVTCQPDHPLFTRLD